MQKVIVTGANGFIGSQLMTQLSRMGYDVRGLIRPFSDVSLVPEELQHRLIRIDYHDEDQLKDVMKGYEIVFHLAGMTKSWKRSELFRANVEVTRNMLDVASEIDSMRQFVFMSSQAAAGQSYSQGIFKQEGDECNPVSGYGKSKLEAEKLVRRWKKPGWTIVRPASVFGPGDRDFLPYFRMMKWHVVVLLSGERRFSVIYSVELVRFLTMLPMQEKAFGQDFFISDGASYTFDKFINFLEEGLSSFATQIQLPSVLLYPATFFAEIVGRIMKRVPILNFQRIADFQGTCWLCSPDKANRLIGWESETGLGDALRETFEWYREHRWL